MSEVTTVGVDLAKNVIVVCGANMAGRVLFFKQFSFRAFGEWAAKIPPCVFGMETCGSAHYWARRLRGYGHSVRLMAAELVKPFRMSQAAKNDRNDAEAIVLAARHPGMRFVTVKSADQQAMLSWHRMRKAWSDERTAMINRMRGLLAEFGIWLGRSPGILKRALPELFEAETLPLHFRSILRLAWEQLRTLEERLEACEREILLHAKTNDDAKRISAISGVGALTASAIVSTVPYAKDFKNGRQLAAWMGLVPQQYSSGGKQRMGQITRRGDAYLRGLLTQGARSALQAALMSKPERRTRLQRWMMDLRERVGYQKALVAIANKHARMIWAILATQKSYDPDAWRLHPKSA
jgi:transposase